VIEREQVIANADATVVAVSNLTRLLVIADEASRHQRPLAVGDLEALCYLLTTDPNAEQLSCSYRYRFSPGPSSGEFETDLAKLEASGYAERQSPLGVSPRGLAWLAGPHRAAAVEHLRVIARRVLPGYLGQEDLPARSVERSQEITRHALDLDRAIVRERESAGS
jgi:hypothetical protein